jgi:hypothetical protein
MSGTGSLASLWTSMGAESDTGCPPPPAAPSWEGYLPFDPVARSQLPSEVRTGGRSPPSGFWRSWAMKSPARLSKAL